MVKSVNIMYYAESGALWVIPPWTERRQKSLDWKGLRAKNEEFQH